MQAAILHLGNKEFVAKVRTDRTVQQAGTEGGGGHAARRQLQEGEETKVNERAKKRTGMQTNSHPYRKVESVLTSRQQVLLSSAGRHRGRRHAGIGRYRLAWIQK